MTRALVPTFGAVLAMLLFVVTLVRGGALLGADGDLFVHVAYGRGILSARGIPAVDPVVYTTAVSDALILHEWLSEVLFALMTDTVGLGGPLLVLALCVSVLPYFVYRRSIARDHGMWVALLAALLVYLGLASHQLARPHLASWVLAPTLVWMLRGWSGGSRGWVDTGLGIVGLAVLWANLHGGGLVLGAVVLGLFGVGAVLDGQAGGRLAAAWQSTSLLGLFLASSLLNPAGWQLHLHLLEFLGHTGENVAADFGPPDLASGTLLTLVVLVAALWPPLVARFRHLSWIDRLLALTLTVMAAASMRNLPFLALLVVPVAADAAKAWVDGASWAGGIRESGARLAAENAPRGGRALAACVLVLGAAWVGLRPPAPMGSAVPDEASAWLAADPALESARGYAGYDASGYLLHLNDVDRVYLHALNANTPWRLMHDHRTLETAAPGWAVLLDRHRVEWTLSLKDSPLADALDAHRCWRRAHEDELWAGHVRTSKRCRGEASPI